MRASILGFIVTVLLLAGFCTPARTSPTSVQRGWPWRLYTSERQRNTSIQNLHVHYLLFYIMVSVGAGFGAGWLTRRLSPVLRVA